MHSLNTRRYLTIKEAATGYFENLISISALYNLINKGDIKSIKIEHKTLIPVSELNSYCNQFFDWSES